MADMISNRVGGVIPHVSRSRDVHVFDGVTYRLTVTWLRRTISVDYNTPRFPRRIRRLREQERRRIEQVTADALRR